MDTKENIINSAKNLFFKFGLRSVTMDDIAKQLGMSKKTLYLHFEDKEEILDQVIEKELAFDRETWQKIDAEGENVMVKIFNGHKHLKKNFEGMNHSLLFEIKKYHPKVWKRYEEHKSNFLHNDIKKILNEGIDEGYFRPNIDVNFLATYRMEQVEMGFNNHTFLNMDKNISEIQTTLEDLFLRGILSEKGLMAYESFCNK